MPQSSPSVLIIRLDGIGDALALTPLIAALRADGIAPDVVLMPANAAIFSTAAVRRVDVAPFALRSRDPENLRALESFGEMLHERAYSHVLVATEDPGGYRLARAIGAPNRVGFTNRWGKPFKTLWARSLLTRTLYRAAGLGAVRRHECEVLFGLGAGIVTDVEPTRALERLRPLLLDADVLRGDSIAVQVTQKWERLGISAGDVAAFIRDARAYYPVLAISSAGEAAFAGAVEREGGGAVTRYDTLHPWKDAIAQARALVAPDSGATHVAGMLGTPTVAVFAQQRHFQRQVARWHPWAAPYRVVALEGGWQSRALADLQELLEQPIER